MFVIDVPELRNYKFTNPETVLCLENVKDIKGLN